ncbi:hypothetical protein FJZ53_07450 [Candidatus Woesearchaeota archaeon]|nr:hypothetical protein [Candidatus Woesearchaeota archaeon]
MKEKIKYGLKKAILKSIAKLYDNRTKCYAKKSSECKNSEQDYRAVLKKITRDKSSEEDKSWTGLKNGFKKLGKQILLDYLISCDRKQAAKYANRSAIYDKKKQEYESRLEELSKPKPESAPLTENKLEKMLGGSESPVQETPEVVNSYDSMKDLYKDYETKNDVLTSTVGKILSGDYVEKGQIVWEWKDRVRKVGTYLGHNQLPELAQKQIFDILKRNQYFMTKRLKELNELSYTLFIGPEINKEVREYLPKV